MSHFGAPTSGEEEEEPLEARMAREMALLEESLSALQASVGALGAGVRAAEVEVADAREAEGKLEAARRDVSAAVLGLCGGGGRTCDGADACATAVEEDLERALAARGLGCVDGFLGEASARAVRAEVLALDAAGPFEPGEVAGGRAGTERTFRRSSVRADRCRFQREAGPGLAALLSAADSLVARLARSGAVAFAPRDSLRTRGDPQLAIYGPACPGYARHVDNPNANGRRLTAVYYCNDHADGAGGELRCECGADAVVLAPVLDRLVVFASERVPHEVLATTGAPGDAPRVAVTLWYCDYDELLAAESRGGAGAREAVLDAVAARRERREVAVGGR